MGARFYGATCRMTRWRFLRTKCILSIMPSKGFGCWVCHCFDRQQADMMNYIVNKIINNSKQRIMLPVSIVATNNRVVLYPN